MISWIYLVGFILWGLLLISFWFKEYPIGMMAAIFMITYGIYIVINGFGEDIAIWIPNAMGIIHIFLGGYILIKGSYDIYSVEL